jgi:hypothetical protein
MRADWYSPERYRTEVWEGSLVTNWSIGQSKRKPKEIPLGDTVILFFAKTGADEPGIYGWSVITLFDKEVIDFRPTSPSDYLKMNPLWDDEIGNIVDKIRGGMPEGTMWKVDDGTLKLLRQKIATYVYGVSS